MNSEIRQRKPEWLRIRHSSGSRAIAETNTIEMMLKELRLNTVCDEAACPNRSECFGNGTATFMIMGRNCTRNCTFCNVEKNPPVPLDAEEPQHVAEAVSRMTLRHAVITSVTRDDLPDGGAGHFKAVIKAIRQRSTSDGTNVRIEVLIPDFRGDPAALSEVVSASPDIIAHNVETVPSLYGRVRPMALYQRSLQVLQNSKALDPLIFTKSGLMLGLGEAEGEVLQVLEDLVAVKCDFLTIGQYLSPSAKHHPVIEYIHPDQFAWYREKALSMGFSHVEPAPLVRSSY
ncbi:MAG: lipoyl synthase, partial [Eubacteriales bacterium]|nr:lipoyl synthase [Eubacteriales bacterium]